MLTVAALLLPTLFVAYANGANDNFKTVATLYGSRVASYRFSILLSTLATLAGSLSAAFLAETLITAFSGKGLVPDGIVGQPVFLLAIAVAAGTTVLLASLRGLPVSTTHALIGALVGAGLAAPGGELQLGALGSVFLLPLLLSPLLSAALVIPLYRMLHGAAGSWGVEKENCICLGPGQFVPVQQLQPNGAAIGPAPLLATANVELLISTPAQCIEKYSGKFFGVTVQRLLDALHCLSAAAISFARGLNDTPKIMGLLVAVKALDVHMSAIAIGLAMAIGGLINGKKVAITMSHKITQMNDGQALTANIVSSFLVIFASRYGVPVSTTHVSVGALAGIGLVNRTLRKNVFAGILAAWLVTLPLSALISALVLSLITHL